MLKESFCPYVIISQSEGVISMNWIHRVTLARFTLVCLPGDVLKLPHVYRILLCDLEISWAILCIYYAIFCEYYASPFPASGTAPLPNKCHTLHFHSACERLILLAHDPHELRDYAALLYHCGYYEGCLEYLTAYETATVTHF
jgi:hypothetical protein